MSKSLSVGDVIIATAKQKRDAAQTRSSPMNAEKPREVILRACETIADQLKDDGFSFAKSGRVDTRWRPRQGQGRVHRWWPNRQFGSAKDMDGMGIRG